MINSLRNDCLKVVCVGTGYFSQFHYDAWQRLPKATMVGVCNRDISKAEDFAKRFSIPEFGNDLAELITRTQPDIVDIITPPQTHLHAVKLLPVWALM